MAIGFVIGRAGSGKTHRCERRIIEALRANPLGSPIILLLPRQATFQAERRLACGGDLPGFSRLHVVNFDTLGRLIAADSGAVAIPAITALGRQLILGHLLRSHGPQLHYFKDSADRPGMAAELDAAMAEFERSGKQLEELDDLVDHYRFAQPDDIDGPSLAAKLHDLRVLFDAYTKFLGQDRLDPHRRLAMVLELTQGSDLLRTAEVYVDGFLEFSLFQRHLLAQLGHVCPRVEVNLTMDPDSPLVANPHHMPDEASLFHRTELTFRQLHFAADDAARLETVLLRQTPRFATAGLAAVERHAFSPDSRPSAAATGVELLEAPTLVAEVDAAARAIQRLLREGLRQRDIVVLARDLSAYEQTLAASFTEHGISYFVDRRRPAAHHPLLQALRAIFAIARDNWPMTATMALVKTGLAGLTATQADALENFIHAHRITGDGWQSPKPWKFQSPVRSPDDPRPQNHAEPIDIETLRQNLVAALAPLLAALRGKSPAPIAALAAAVFDGFSRLGIDRTLGAWVSADRAAGHFEQSAEHEQVWAALVSLFEQMVDLLGPETVAPTVFMEMVNSALERFDLAVRPPTVDQVLVGQIDRTVAPPQKAAIVLGLSAGEFPRPPRDVSLLSRAERGALRSRDLDFDPDVHRRLLDEQLLGYLAFTRASDHLIVSRPLADAKGRAVEPSEFFLRLAALLPSAPITRLAPSAAVAASQVATPRQLVGGMLDWARGRREDTADSAAWAALYQWMATRPCDVESDPIERLRNLAWPSLRYDNVARLSDELAGRLFAAPLRVTARQLETFAACPFQHFVRYGLRVAERQSQQVTALDTSQIFHETLEALLVDYLDRDMSLAATAEKIDEAANNVAAKLRGQVMLDDARNRFLLSHIRWMLGEVIATQRETLRRSEVKPHHNGVVFGQSGSALPAVKTTTSSGQSVEVSGRIDRIDMPNDHRGVSVVDYKMSAAPLSLPEVYYGLSLQLLTALLAALGGSKEFLGRTSDAAAALRLPLTRHLQAVDHPDDALAADDPRFALRAKPRGIIDQRLLSAFDPNLSVGKSDLMNATINKSGSLKRGGDVAAPDELRALLDWVLHRIAEAAAGILSNTIAVHPYRLRQTSRCASCDYRAVCRFEAGVNSYRHLEPIDAKGVMAAVTQPSIELKGGPAHGR